MDIRLGNGFDVHAFQKGRNLILCGLKIPHSMGLAGHSDADVAIHAITDAIYGALGFGDIGKHFPPSDSRWENANSDIFLRHAVSLCLENQFSISNIDCTIICEFPKIAPFTESMIKSLSDILELAEDRISVKATTSERLGFTGREEGIACIATACLIRNCKPV